MTWGFALLRLAFFTSPFLLFRIGGITISDYLFLVAFVLSLLQNRQQYFRSQILPKLLLPTLVIFSAASLSVVVNGNRLDGMITLLKFFVLLIAIPRTCKIFCQSLIEFQSLLRTYMFGLIFFSSFIFFSRIVNYGLFTPTTLYRSVGLAEHVTDAGGICTISLVAHLIFFQPKYRLTKSLFVIIALFALGSTGSLSGYIASLVGFVFYIAIEIRTGNRLQILQLPLLGLIVAYFLNRYLAIESRIQHATTGRYDTASSRFENWAATIQSSTENLSNFIFGRGLHPKDNVIISTNGELLAPHNILLESLSAAGIFFALGILIYLVQVAKFSVRFDTPYNFVPLLAASSVFAMTSPLMYSRYIWLPFLLALQHSVLAEKQKQLNE